MLSINLNLQEYGKTSNLSNGIPDFAYIYLSKNIICPRLGCSGLIGESGFGC